MNPMLHWLASPEWTHLVGALLHSLWQGAILAIALALTLRRLTNPVTRYRCALGALGLLLIANLITWAVLNAPQPAAPVASPAPTLAAPAPTTANAFQPNAADKIITSAALAQPQAKINWTAWIALFWMFGTLLMLCRASIKVAGAEKLRRSCRPLNDEPIALLVAEACRAVKLTRKIRVTVTDQLTSPAVVGVLVPTLILPLSLFTTLTPTQIQFVLLHELAHIRRGDYLANLFQLFAEALWFFNPAAWWISHQIRREREACCDALAIDLSGAPADYARTLVHVAENILQPAPAAAATFGDAEREPSSLTDRVQRLLVPGYRPALRLTWRAMLTGLFVGGALLFLSALGARNTVGAILTSNQSNTFSVSQDSLTNQTTTVPTLTESVGYDLATAATFVPPPVTSTGQRIDSILPLPIFRVRQISTNREGQTNVLGRLYSDTGAKDKVPFLGDLPGLGKLFISESFAAKQTWLGGDDSFGMSDWTVGGQNQTNQQWFWYRTAGVPNETKRSTSPQPPEPVYTREFEATPEVFRQRLYNGLPVIVSSHLKTDTSNTNLAQEQILSWLRELGIHLDPALGKSFYLKGGQGRLLVRATKSELDRIEIALRDASSDRAQQNAATSAPELATRTFQVEPTTIAKAIETQLPQFKPVTATNVTAGLRALLESAGADLSPPKSIYYNDRAGGLFVRAAPQELDAIEELLQVIGRQPLQVNVKAVFVELPFGKSLPKDLMDILGPITQMNNTNFTGILTASKFPIILRALEKNSEAKILAMPQVTTMSGRQAQLQVADVKTILNGLAVTAVVSNSVTNLVYQSQAMSFGTVLDVLPVVDSDGFTVQMTLIPTVTEFLGYEDPKKLKLAASADQGTFPLPIIRTRRMTTSASVWDGQTIVLGNLSDQLLDAPVTLKGTPKTSAKNQGKQLLVFVTPTIIDQAGNRANPDLGTSSVLIR